MIRPRREEDPLPLLAELRDEHRLVDDLAGALRRWLEDGAEEGDRRRFVAVLRGWVHERHEAREEEILFPALVEHAEVPADRGPLAVLRHEHQQLRRLVDRLEEAATGAEVEMVVVKLARLLWEHVDKEDSVLLPEARERLRRSALRELSGPPATPELQAMRAEAEALVVRHPPLDDPDLVRGEGCIACSAFGETCRGIEAEWWNAWEWEWHRSRED